MVHLGPARFSSDSRSVEPDNTEERDETHPQPSPPSRHTASFIRILALLCTCSLSVGSHYASYILGPIKSRLAREIGTSHTDFSLLIAAFSLNSTWTPLIGGLLASKVGTTATSILATGVIFLGQLLLLVGDMWGNVRLMALGLFVFGLGVSPLAVVQETIIVRFFKSHGLGVSMAFGLLAGKGASFIAARTSYPLTEHFGPRAPFYAATTLAGLSVVVNLIYISASKWMVSGAGAELEASDISAEAQVRRFTNVSEAQALEKVAARRRVNLREVAKLGDLFWAYIGLNVLCGMIWSPFLHLSANIIEARYKMTERDAATQASYLLAGSVFLYPICGYLVDFFKHQSIVVQLFTVSSCLTLSAYTLLALPPTWTQTPTPSIFLFALGQGYSPLLLVLLIPKILSSKYVSTALGAHKSIEQTGSVIFQTFAGLSLDLHKNPGGGNGSLQGLLNAFVFFNVLHLSSILGLATLQRRRTSLVEMTSASETQPLLHSLDDTSNTLAENQNVQSNSELRRGVVFAILSAMLVAFAWVLFLGTAWLRLGKGNH